MHEHVLVLVCRSDCCGGEQHTGLQSQVENLALTLPGACVTGDLPTSVSPDRASDTRRVPMRSKGDNAQKGLRTGRGTQYLEGAG